LPEDNSFAGWAAEQGLDEAEAAPDAVLNPAGIPNLLVYALSGGDPRTATPDLLPWQEAWDLDDEAEQYFSLIFRRNPNATGIEYRGEFSADLHAGWTTEGVVMESLESDGLEEPGHDYWRIIAPAPRESSLRQFLRLKVVIP
jgi:hypothetical protein